MRAKDIKPGEVYAVVAMEPFRGKRRLGEHVIPFRVSKVEKTEVRRASTGPGTWGGDMRVFGDKLDAGTMKKIGEEERGYVLAKVLGPWDALAYRQQQEEQANREETDRRDRELGTLICNRLADLSVGASYSEQGIRIARPSMVFLAKALGVDVPEEIS